MRLERIYSFLKEKGVDFRYSENDDCGAIDFVYRGLGYHIWEYPEPERGASSNLFHTGKMTDYEGDYEQQLLDILFTWNL